MLTNSESFGVILVNHALVFQALFGHDREPEHGQSSKSLRPDCSPF
jgi:hypothetical protein